MNKQRNFNNILDSNRRYRSHSTPLVDVASILRDLEQPDYK